MERKKLITFRWKVILENGRVSPQNETLTDGQ